MRRNNRTEDERYVSLETRLRPFLGEASTGDESRSVPGAALDAELIDERVLERALNLLMFMPRNQRRETIEDLLYPEDHERGRRAVDALIKAAYIAEDEYTGCLRRVR